MRTILDDSIAQFIAHLYMQLYHFFFMDTKFISEIKSSHLHHIRTIRIDGQVGLSLSHVRSKTTQCLLPKSKRIQILTEPIWKVFCSCEPSAFSLYGNSRLPTGRRKGPLSFSKHRNCCSCCCCATESAPSLTMGEEVNNLHLFRPNWYYTCSSPNAILNAY